MPKSRKRKTRIKKKNNPSTRKKRINEDVDIPVVPLLESTTENETEVGSEIEMEDFADVSEERSGIISIVKDLEGQIDTAYELKGVLEAELDAIQKKLSEESAARAELEQRVKSVEAQAALAEQLHEDISFAEQERNKFADSLAQTRQQLKAVNNERDSLARQTASAATHINELESDKTALEAQVMNLKDKVTDMGRLRTEFAEIKKARQGLDEQVRGLSSRLEASDTSKDTFEKELAEAREQVENLRDKLMGAESQVADLRPQFEQQQAVNKDLMETKRRLENKIKTLNVNYKATKKELDAFRKAMRDIRSEAVRTSGRVRQRYFKPSTASDSL